VYGDVIQLKHKKTSGFGRMRMGNGGTYIFLPDFYGSSLRWEGLYFYAQKKAEAYITPVRKPRIGTHIWPSHIMATHLQSACASDFRKRLLSVHFPP
jgi:hypothetical protein